MSDGVKVALIVGGVAVGTYIVVKAIAPTPAVKPSSVSAASTATAFVSGITAIANLFKTSPNSSPANAPLTNIDVPLTQDQLSEAQQFRSEDPTTQTDNQRDIAILG